MFRQKSFFGLLFGIGLIISGTWVSFKFNISGEKLLIGWIIFSTVLGVFFSSFNEISFKISCYFSKLQRDIKWSRSKREMKRYNKSLLDLMEIKSESQKKDFLIKKSKKMKLNLFYLENLIKKCGINDDEFWIEIFINNINEKSKFYNLDLFYGFLFRLKSENSQNKLEDILKSKKILIEDIDSEVIKKRIFLINTPIDSVEGKILEEKRTKEKYNKEIIEKFMLNKTNPFLKTKD